MTAFCFEPIRFFASNRLLSGADPANLPALVEITDDLNRAMEVENSDTPPAGYAIWRDVLAGAVSEFHATPIGQHGRELIEAEAAAIWQGRGEFERALKIKHLRKTLSDFEDFWLTTAYDIFELLQSVSLGRYVHGQAGQPVLEAIHAVFRAGFYPCGWRRDGRICAFDPRLLDGHRPVW